MTPAAAPTARATVTHAGWGVGGGLHRHPDAFAAAAPGPYRNAAQTVAPNAGGPDFDRPRAYGAGQAVVTASEHAGNAGRAQGACRGNVDTKQSF